MLRGQHLYLARLVALDPQYIQIPGVEGVKMNANPIEMDLPADSAWGRLVGDCPIASRMVQHALLLPGVPVTRKLPQPPKRVFGAGCTQMPEGWRC